VKFFVQNSTRSGHPLDIAWADSPTLASGVPMRDFALIDDRHGFKAAMRMRADSTRRRSSGEDCRASKVKQQEGTDNARLCAITE